MASYLAKSLPKPSHDHSSYSVEPIVSQKLLLLLLLVQIEQKGVDYT